MLAGVGFDVRVPSGSVGVLGGWSRAESLEDGHIGLAGLVAVCRVGGKQQKSGENGIESATASNKCIIDVCRECEEREGVF